MAEHTGRGATDEKTIFLLTGAGPLTAGESAQHTGLATASVTSLLDRLERKGFVRRVRDSADRRRVMAELDATRFAELVRLFVALGDTLSLLLDGFNDAQLLTNTEFVTRATQYARQAMARLHQATAGRESA
jgi:DNA-binding MarR family transcriptional regulator